MADGACASREADWVLSLWEQGTTAHEGELMEGGAHAAPVSVHGSAPGTPEHTAGVVPLDTSALLDFELDPEALALPVCLDCAAPDVCCVSEVSADNAVAPGAAAAGTTGATSAAGTPASSARQGAAPSGSAPAQAPAASSEEEKRQQRLVKNRESAHNSRQRKKQHVDELEQRVRTLEATNGDLQSLVVRLSAENAQLRGQLAAVSAAPQAAAGTAAMAAGAVCVAGVAPVAGVAGVAAPTHVFMPAGTMVPVSAMGGLLQAKLPLPPVNAAVSPAPRADGKKRGGGGGGGGQAASKRKKASGAGIATLATFAMVAMLGPYGGQQEGAQSEAPAVRAGARRLQSLPDAAVVLNDTTAESAASLAKETLQAMDPRNETLEEYPLVPVRRLAPAADPSDASSAALALASPAHDKELFPFELSEADFVKAAFKGSAGMLAQSSLGALGGISPLACHEVFSFTSDTAQVPAKREQHVREHAATAFATPRRMGIRGTDSIPMLPTRAEIEQRERERRTADEETGWRDARENVTSGLGPEGDSGVVVSVLVPPTPLGGKQQKDGGLSQVFVVLALNAAKYATFSCSVPSVAAA